MYCKNSFGIPLWIIIIVILFIIIFKSCYICCDNEINKENFLNITDMKNYIEKVYDITDAPDNNNLTNQLNIYNFYANWCPHSVNFKPIWNEFEKEIEKTKGKYKFSIKTHSIICDENQELCNKYNIQGLPTVLYEYNGNVKKYSNNRSKESLLNFIQENYVN